MFNRALQWGGGSVLRPQDDETYFGQMCPPYFIVDWYIIIAWCFLWYGDADGSLPFPSPDKALKDSLDRVLLSGYFDKAQSHQNGVCEEEEEDEEQQLEAVVESAEEQTVDQGQHFWHWR